MESMLVTVLVGCFLALMVPAVFAGLVDAAALDGETDVTPAPLAPVATNGAFEAEERIAA